MVCAGSPCAAVEHENAQLLAIGPVQAGPGDGLGAQILPLAYVMCCECVSVVFLLGAQLLAIMDRYQLGLVGRAFWRIHSIMLAA